MRYEQINRKVRPDLGAAAIGRLLVDPTVAERNAAVLAEIAKAVELPLLPNPRLGLPYFAESMLIRHGFRSLREATGQYEGRFSRQEVDIVLESDAHFSGGGMVTRRVEIPKVIRDEVRGYSSAIRTCGNIVEPLNPIGQSSDGVSMLMRVGQLASYFRSPDAARRAEVSELLARAWEPEEVMLGPVQIIESNGRWRQMDQAFTYQAAQNQRTHGA